MDPCRARTFQIADCCYAATMKRVWPLVSLVVALSLLAVPFALAANSESSAAAGDRSPGAPLAAAISTVTGIAISPLLGTGAFGLYRWYQAKDPASRASLPWYAQPLFWAPALLLVGICAAKDAFGAVVPPGWKKPLDVLETIENKFSGLIAAGAVVPLTMIALSESLTGSPTAAAGLQSSGLAMLSLGTVDAAWLLNFVTVPLGVAIFVVVWLASHTINVLILLSPWGAIDAALKSARTALLGLLTLSAAMNPWVGAALSLAVILLAFLIAGWAFRLAVFGTVFSWDFLTLRRLRFVPGEHGNALFAGGNLPDVPARSYGRLQVNAAGEYEFVFRRWLWRPPRMVKVAGAPLDLAVGRGLFFSIITRAECDTLFLLPPRYRGHEEQIASLYGFGGGVRPAGLRKAWTVLRELFGGSAARTQVV